MKINIENCISKKEFNYKYRPLKWKNLEERNILTLEDLAKTSIEIFADKAGNKKDAFFQLKRDLISTPSANLEKNKKYLLKTYSDEDDFLTNWISFLSEYATKAVEVKHQLIFKYYIGEIIVEGESKTYITNVAKILNQNRETLRLNLNELKIDLKSNTLNDNHDSFHINDKILNNLLEFKSILQEKKYLPTYIVLKNISNKDYKDLSYKEKKCYHCLVEIFDFQIIEGKVITNQLETPNLIIPGNIKVKNLETITIKVKQLVDNNIKPLSKIEIINNLKKELLFVGIEEIINAIIKNFDLFVQNEEGNYYLKSPSSVTMLYLALKNLDGIDTNENIEKKIKQMFPNENHISGYRNILSRVKDIFFNVGKNNIFGLNEIYPELKEKIGSGTYADIAYKILNLEENPVFGRNLFSKAFSIFPDKIKSNFEEISFLNGVYSNESKHRFIKYPGPYYGINQKSYDGFNSKTLPGIIIRSISKRINEQETSYNDIILEFSNEYDLKEEQIRKIIDDNIEIGKFIRNEEILSINSNSETIRDENDFDDDNVGVTEGEKIIATHQKIERDSYIIRKVKNKRDWICEICNLKMEKVYNVAFIEAHHKIALSESEKTITNEEDIALLCPNCHTAIHQLMLGKKDTRYLDLKQDLIFFIV